MDDDGARVQRALKAAATRAENAEKERRNNEQLAKETEGGRPAKRKALEHRVWREPSNKEKPYSNESRSKDNKPSTEKQRTKKKSRNAHKKEKRAKPKKQAKPKPQEDLYNGEDERNYKRGPSHPPPAASLDSEDSEDGSDPNLDSRSVKDKKNSSYRYVKADKNKDKNKDKINSRTALSTSKRGRSTNITRSDSSNEEAEYSLSSDSDSDSEDSDSESESESESDTQEKRPRSPDVDPVPRPTNAWPAELDDSDREIAANSTTKGKDRSRSNYLPPELEFNDDGVVSPSPCRGSSHASVPPTSDIADTSSGCGGDGTFELDDEPFPLVTGSRKRSHHVIHSDDQVSSDGKKPAKSRKKAKTTRRNTLSAERPVVQPPAKPAASKKRAKDLASPTGDTSLLVFASGTSKRIRLKEQPALIQEILHHGIARASEDVLLVKTWPESETSRNIYGKGILLDVCGNPSLVKSYGKDMLSDVKKLVKHNSKFTKAMSDVVVDRLALVRSPAKVEAAKFIPHYELGLGEKCKTRVKSLLEGFSFHFPGSWGGSDGQTWQPNNRKEAFLNPVIIETLRAAYFASPTKGVGYRYVDKFVSSVPAKNDEKELPVALLALIYSCLYEFRNGKQETTDFDGNLFLATNKDFFNLFASLRENKPLEFHNRMHQLYNMVLNVPQATALTTNAAYDIIDF